MSNEKTVTEEKRADGEPCSRPSCGCGDDCRCGEACVCTPQAACTEA